MRKKNLNYLNILKIFEYLSILKNFHQKIEMNLKY